MSLKDDCIIIIKKKKKFHTNIDKNSDVNAILRFKCSNTIVLIVHLEKVGLAHMTR